MKFFGIAGGSGSGKSTVAISLCKKYPEKIALIHVDDYFVAKVDAPIHGEFTNWDHPASVRFDDLYADMLSLSAGRSIAVRTKSELYNPDYNPKIKNKIQQIIEPKPITVLEGYLALYDARVRGLLNWKIYLDIPIEESTRRRSANKFTLDQKYYTEVLLPMHRQFVEPTKKYADVVIDVSRLTPQEVLKEIELMLFS